jgi:hypothetical protein
MANFALDRRRIGVPRSREAGFPADERAGAALVGTARIAKAFLLLPPDGIERPQAKMPGRQGIKTAQVARTSNSVHRMRDVKIEEC